MSHIACSRMLDTQFNSAFDPKPFIRTLEAAVDRLIAVRKDVQARTEQMEKSVKVTEREYSKKMADLNKGFEVCCALHCVDQYPKTTLRLLANHSQEWRPR